MAKNTIEKDLIRWIDHFVEEGHPAARTLVCACAELSELRRKVELLSDTQAQGSTDQGEMTF